MSEVSDAVVVVVSEERGEVSVVHRGEVTPIAFPIELEQTLQRLLGWDIQGSRTRAIRREFFRQVGGFFLTTLAVTTYWTIFYGQQAAVTNVNIRIDFRNLPEGLELTWSSNETLDVQVRGQRPLIEDLKRRPEQVGASVNLRNLGPGEGQEIHLSDENVELPVGLEVARLTPTSIIVDLHRRVSKRVPVRLQIRPEPPEGTQILVEPDSVLLVGPESEIRAIQQVITNPVVLGPAEAQQSQFTKTATLEALPDSVRLGPDQPEQVRVTIRRPAPEPPPPTPKDAATPGKPAKP